MMAIPLLLLTPPCYNTLTYISLTHINTPLQHDAKQNALRNPLNAREDVSTSDMESASGLVLWTFVVALVSALLALLALQVTIWYGRRERADEKPQMVIDSVHEIRSRLMKDIERLDETSEDAPTLLRLQAASREFLTVAESMPHLEHSLPPQDERLNAFLDALLSLRQVFNTEMDNLRSKYGIEAGPPPEDVNPFIGRPIREIYIPPPTWLEQSDESEPRPPRTDLPEQDNQPTE